MCHTTLLINKKKRGLVITFFHHCNLQLVAWHDFLEIIIKWVHVNMSKFKALSLLQKGKNMVRWLIFYILKTPHLTLVRILTIKIIIKLWFQKYPLCFWPQILISHFIDIPKNVIGQKINMHLGNFNVKWKKMTKNENNHNISKELQWFFFVLEKFHYIFILNFSIDNGFFNKKFLHYNDTFFEFTFFTFFGWQTQCHHFKSPLWVHVFPKTHL